MSEVELASRHIKAGTFDLFLLRPAGTLLAAVRGRVRAAPASDGSSSRSSSSSIVLGRFDVAWTPVKVALIPITILSGAVIFGAIWVITSSLVVLDGRDAGGRQLVHVRRRDAVAVPDRRLRHLAPALRHVRRAARLRRATSPPRTCSTSPCRSGCRRRSRCLSPFVAAALALVARAVWRLAIRHYRSTGS